MFRRLSQLGHNICHRVAVDFDPLCAETFCRSHGFTDAAVGPTDVIWDSDQVPERLVVQGDVIDPRWYHLLSDDKFDLTVLSPPCPAWSRATSCPGAARHEGRLTLYAWALLNLLRPRVGCTEIVGSMKGHEHWSLVKMMILWSGYSIRYARVLNLAEFSPQHRERLILVATLDGEELHPHICTQWPPTQRHTMESYMNIRTPDGPWIEQMKIDRVVPSQYLDPGLLPKQANEKGRQAKKSRKDVESYRIKHAQSIFGCIMASYGSAHDLPGGLLQQFGLYGTILAQADGLRFLSTPEIVISFSALMLFGLPTDQKEAVKMMGNAISIPHAMVGILNAMAFLSGYSGVERKKFTSRNLRWEQKWGDFHSPKMKTQFHLRWRCMRFRRLWCIHPQNNFCNVVELINRGHFQSILHKLPNSDLISKLAEVWDANRFRVRKVKSHKSFASAKDWRDLWHIVGNHCADSAATAVLGSLPTVMKDLANRIETFYNKEEKILLEHFSYLAAFLQQSQDTSNCHKGERDERSQSKSKSTKKTSGKECGPFWYRGNGAGSIWPDVQLWPSRLFKSQCPITRWWGFPTLPSGIEPRKGILQLGSIAQVANEFSRGGQVWLGHELAGTGVQFLYHHRLLRAQQEGRYSSKIGLYTILRTWSTFITKQQTSGISADSEFSESFLNKTCLQYRINRSFLIFGSQNARVSSASGMCAQLRVSREDCLFPNNVRLWRRYRGIYNHCKVLQHYVDLFLSRTWYLRWRWATFRNLQLNNDTTTTCNIWKRKGSSSAAIRCR